MLSDGSSLHMSVALIALITVIGVLAVAGCVILVLLLKTSDAAARKWCRWLAGFVVFLVMAGIVIAFTLSLLRNASRIQLAVSARVSSLAIPSAQIAATERRMAEHDSIVLDPVNVAHEAKIGASDAREQSDTDNETSDTKAGAAALPDWAQDFQEDILPESASISVVRSGQFATIEQAEADALHKAVLAATRHITSRNSYFSSNWQAPETLVQEHIVRQTYLETLERDFRTITAPMYRVYLQIDLSDLATVPLVEAGQKSVATHRLCLIGGVLGIAVVLLGIFSAILRLEKNVTPPEIPATRTA